MSSIYLAKGKTFQVSSFNDVCEDPFTVQMGLDLIEPSEPVRVGDANFANLDAGEQTISSGGLADNLVKYFGEQDGDTILMWLYANQDSPNLGLGDEGCFFLCPVDGAATTFRLSLKKSFLEGICKILPSPFLQLKGLIKEGTNKDPVQVEKQFDLSGLLGSSGTTVDTEPFTVLNEYYGRQLVFDIVIGWAAGPLLKEIKISADSIVNMLWANESGKDVALVGGRGFEVKCHQFILAGHSPVFSSMLSASSSGVRQLTTKRIKLGLNTIAGLQYLVRYMYGMEVPINNVATADAVELFEVARKYGLNHLGDCLRELLLQKEVSWFTPDTLLRLYVYVKDAKGLGMLQKHTLQLLAKMNMEKLKSCDGYKKLAPEDSLELSFKLVNLLQGQGK